MSTKQDNAPKHLGTDGRRWWLAMTDAYDFENDPSALELLAQAAMLVDRIVTARECIREGGLLSADRFGQVKESAAAVTERACMNQFRLLVRELQLDTTTAESVRLPRIAGRYAS